MASQESFQSKEPLQLSQKQKNFMQGNQKYSQFN